MSKHEQGKPSKPAGKTGPLTLGADGVYRKLVRFPEDKAERELMVARLFVNAANQSSIPMSPLRPISGLVQNSEDDLDFTIQTAIGPKLMELTEFAPLKRLKADYANAPRHFHPAQLAGYYLDLVEKKSLRQGGEDRILVTYRTHDRFMIAGPSLELARRGLKRRPPRFERVFLLHPHDQTGATLFEVYPKTPRSFFEEMSDEKLANLQYHQVNFGDAPVKTDP